MLSFLPIMLSTCAILYRHSGFLVWSKTKRGFLLKNLFPDTKYPGLYLSRISCIIGYILFVIYYLFFLMLRIGLNMIFFSKVIKCLTLPLICMQIFFNCRTHGQVYWGLWTTLLTIKTLSLQLLALATGMTLIW